jgi:hypothetical protein
MKSGRYKDKQLARASYFIHATTGIPSLGAKDANGNWLVFRTVLQEDIARWSASRDEPENAFLEIPKGERDRLQYVILLADDTHTAEIEDYRMKYIGCMDEHHDMIYCHSTDYLEGTLVGCNHK